MKMLEEKQKKLSEKLKNIVQINKEKDSKRKIESISIHFQRKSTVLRCFFVFYTLKRRSRYAGKGQYSSPTIISSSSATSRS